MNIRRPKGTFYISKWEIIYFFVEYTKGRDYPQELDEKVYNNFGVKNVRPLMRTTESIFGGGRAVVLGSEFCLLKVLFGKVKRGCLFQL